MRFVRVRRCAGVALALMLTATAVSACGSNGDGGARPAAPTSPTVPCPGEPIKVTTIATLTGPLAFTETSRDYQESVDAALAAVNGACTAGRPLEVEICDDQSDPNTSTECGRQAAADGSVALFGSLGSTDNGANAAGLPAVLTRASTAFDVLDSNAYPATSLLTLIMANVSAAAGAGVDSMLFVAVDSPQLQASIPLLTQLAADFSIELDFLLYPADTTDFSAIAAQIAEKDPDAISLAAPSIVPLMNALEAEGITPQNKFISAGVDVMSPSVLAELGDKLDGAFAPSDVVPPQDSDNPGIQQMRAEYEAAGIDTDPAEMSVIATLMWSKVHILAETIGALTPEARASLGSQQLVDALISRGEISRPEFAPFDFSKHAFPEIGALSAYRVFGDQVMVIQVQDGSYKTVAPFQDITQPIKLEATS